jgi:two-component system, OmpR family, KDP operon response regulator KdpE
MLENQSPREDSPKRILIVEDEPYTLNLLQLIFSASGYATVTASSGKEGVQFFHTHRPDLIVLDILLPDIHGLEVCEKILSHTQVPIVFLSALSEEEDIVRGLDCGAIDYITKPFSTKVLLARVRAALRLRDLTSPPATATVYKDDYLTVDLSAQQVWCNDLQVKLTPTEYSLLAYLLQNAGRPCTFQEILENVWGTEYRDSTHYVHVYVGHLRRKLEQNPKQPVYLKTVYGCGYRFVPQEITGSP